MKKELNYRELAKTFLKGEFNECFVTDSEENITKIASYYEMMCDGKGEEAVAEATEYLQDNEKVIDKAIKDMKKGITTTITEDQCGNFTVEKYKDGKKL